MCDFDNEEYIPETDERCILRNGMDCEVKKTYPPDYSNVPSARDWQMSIFGNDRYDLDEVQKMEAKGYKFRHIAAEMRRRYEEGLPPTQAPITFCPPCQRCAEREMAEQRRRDGTEGGNVYVPYGPPPTPSLVFPKDDPDAYRPYGVAMLPSSHVRLNMPPKMPPAPHPDILTTDRR